MCHPIIRIPFEVDDVVAMVRKVFAGRVVFHDGVQQIAPGIATTVNRRSIVACCYKKRQPVEQRNLL